MQWSRPIWGDETAATPYYLYEVMQRMLIRSFRVSGRAIPEQFNGFEQIGPMNSYQFTQVESILDAAFEEEA